MLNRNFTAVRSFQDRISFRATKVAFRGTSLALPPALREKLKKEGERGQDGKRARGQEGERGRDRERERKREKMCEDG